MVYTKGIEYGHMSPEVIPTPQPEEEKQSPRYEAGRQRAVDHRDDFEKRMTGLLADVAEAQLQIGALRERQATEQALIKNLKGSEGISKAREAEDSTLREIAKWERKVLDTTEILEREKRSLLN